MSDELADRELDKLIAEQLFGIPSGKSPKTHMIDARPIPNFSTDISAAMQVVENLAHGHAFACWRVPSVSSVTWGWTAKFDESVYPPEPTTKCATGRDESLPRAICLAALAACQTRLIPT